MRNQYQVNKSGVDRDKQYINELETKIESLNFSNDNLKAKINQLENSRGRQASLPAVKKSGTANSSLKDFNFNYMTNKDSISNRYSGF